MRVGVNIGETVIAIEEELNISLGLLDELSAENKGSNSSKKCWFSTYKVSKARKKNSAVGASIGTVETEKQ